MVLSIMMQLTGDSLLMVAARHGMVAEAQALIDRGADVNYNNIVIVYFLPIDL